MERQKNPSRNISDETLKVIRDRFDNDPIVIKMRIEQDMALRARHNPTEAMKIGAKINALFNSVVVDYCARCEKEAEALEKGVKLADMGMTEEQAQGVVTVCVSLFMLCDIAESAIMEVTSSIKKVNENFDFEMFSDVKDTMGALKNKLRILTKSTNLRDDARWGTECDRMYMMMKNKASKIMRMSESEGWGK